MTNKFDIAFETNPFRADLPDSISEISPPLFEFMSLQTQNLRDFADQVQTGNVMIPPAHVLKRSATQLYPLGVKAQTQTSLGILGLEFVQFTYEVDPTNLGVLTYAKTYQVAKTGDSGDFKGVDFTNSGGGLYGWLIVSGLLDSDFTTLTGLKAGDQISASGNGFISGLYHCGEVVSASQIYLYGRVNEISGGTGDVQALAQIVSQQGDQINQLTAQVNTLSSGLDARFQDLMDQLSLISITLGRDGSATSDTALSDIKATLTRLTTLTASHSDEIGDALSLIQSQGLALSQITSNQNNQADQLQTIASIATNSGLLALRGIDNANTARIEAVSNQSVVAGYGVSYLNKNPLFTSWSIANELPDSWIRLRDGPVYSRVPRVTGAGTAIGIDMPASGEIAALGQYGGDICTPVKNGDWLVVELDFWLRAGTQQTVDVVVDILADDFSYQGYALIEHLTDLPIGQVRRYRKLIQITQANGTKANPYINCSLSNGYGVERFGLRAASSAEILANTAIPDLQASVTQQSGVIVDLGNQVTTATNTANAAQGTANTANSNANSALSGVSGLNTALTNNVYPKLIAYLINEVIAGTSSAAVRMYATDINGNPASYITMIADAISLVNGSTTTMLVTAGRAVFSGDLQATAGIYLGTGSAVWPVALASRDFVASDGGTVTFPVNLQRIPALVFDTLGLDPLNSGERYNLYADGLTSTGFTARLRIITPGSAQGYSYNNTYYSTDINGTVVDRGPGASYPEADGHLYTYHYYMSLNFSAHGPNDSSASVIVNYYAYVPGSAWVYVTSEEYSFTSSGGTSGPLVATPSPTLTLPNGTTSFGATWSITYSDSPVNMQTAQLNSVSWSATTATASRTATSGGQQTRITVRPQ